MHYLADIEVDEPQNFTHAQLELAAMFRGFSLISSVMAMGLSSGTTTKFGGILMTDV